MQIHLRRGGVGVNIMEEAEKITCQILHDLTPKNSSMSHLLCFRYTSLLLPMPSQSLVSNWCPGNVYKVLGWKPMLAARKLLAFCVEGEASHSFPFPLTPCLTCPPLLLAATGLDGRCREKSLSSFLWALRLLLKVSFLYKSPFLWLSVKTPDSPTIHLISALDFR